MHMGVVVNAADVNDAATWAMGAAGDWDFHDLSPDFVEDDDEDAFIQGVQNDMEGLVIGGQHDSGPGLYALTVTRIGMLNEAGREHDAEYAVEVAQFMPFCKDEPSTARGEQLMEVAQVRAALDSAVPTASPLTAPRLRI